MAVPAQDTRHFVEEWRRALHRLVAERAFEYGEFVLSSGRKSHYYFDGKQVTLCPEGAYLLARIVVEKIRNDDIRAIGGPTIGADPIAGAVAAVAYVEGLRDLKLFIVRKEPKQHGKRRWIEGPPLVPGDRVVVVEDVITTGSSVRRAIEVLREAGCVVTRVIVLVDRLEGGAEACARLGVPLDPIFTIRDFGGTL